MRKKESGDIDKRMESKSDSKDKKSVERERISPMTSPSRPLTGMEFLLFLVDWYLLSFDVADFSAVVLRNYASSAIDCA